MAPALLVALALLHGAQAVRTTENLGNLPVGVDEELCEQAASYEPWRYTLSYQASKGIGHNQHFTLRLDANCQGEDLGSVSVIPVIHPAKPLELSTARITVKPQDFHVKLYVCRVGRGHGHCVASVLPPSRGFRPHQLLLWVPIIKNDRRLQALSVGETHEVVDILEWVMLLIILSFLGTTIHAIYILVKTLHHVHDAGGEGRTSTRVSGGSATTRVSGGSAITRVSEGSTTARVSEGRTSASAGPQQGGDDASRSNEADSSAVLEDKQEEPQEPLCPVDISDPFAEAMDAWMHSANFVVACVSLLGVLLAVLVNADGPPAVIGLIVCWPCVFGNFLLYCFWMTSCRLQLYSAGLARGICIRGKDPLNPSTILMAGCFSILLLGVLGAVYSLWEGAGREAMAKKVLPYVINPLCTMASVIFYVYMRMLHHHKTQLHTAMDQLVQLLNAPAATSQAKADAAEPTEPAGRLLAERVRFGDVPIISEGAFCELCRKGVDPVRAINAKEALEEGKAFGFPDLAWHGKMVYELSDYSVAILNVPVALFFFFILTGASVVFAIVCLTTRPSLSSILMAENSLGWVNPELRPWQTDYELLLDSTVHSFAFVATSSADSTTMMRFAFPDGNSLETYKDWHLSTVQLDGTIFPTTVGIEAHGIRRQTTQYSLTVVKDYQMLVGVRLFGGKSFDRFLAWGQVRGGIFSVPESVSTIHIQICTVPFKLGVPVNETEAIANEGAGHLQTVFRPMEANAIACRSHCRSEARCLMELVGKEGCFFIYGPFRVDRKFFSKMAEPSAKDKELAGSNPDVFVKQGALGGTICTRRGLDMQECSNMQNPAPNILSASMKMDDRSKVQKSRFRLYKAFGGREVPDTDSPTISLAYGIPIPVGYYSFAKGVASTDKVKVVVGKYVELKVSLGRYVPNSYQQDLLLHVAILLPDKTFDVVDPNGGAVDFVSSPPRFRQCKDPEDPMKQFSVCGGWRPSDVVALKLDPWRPWKQVDLKVVPRKGGYESLLVKVKIRTENGREPADWAVSQNCSLDLRAMSQQDAEDLLTLQVFETMAKKCTNATIRFRRHDWEPTVAAFVKDMIAYDMSLDSAVRLLASADKNRGIRNYTQFLEEVGLQHCLEEACLHITGTVYGDKILPMRLHELAGHPNSTGRIVKAVCALEDPAKITASVLNSAVQGGNVEVVRSVIDCIKMKLGYISLMSRPHGSGEHLYSHPAVSAIAQRRHDLLALVLQVGTVCTSILDGSPQGSTFMEFAVARGCDKCVKILLKKGLGGEQLAFSPVTSPSLWRDGADAALAEAPVKRLSFANSQAKVMRIWMKLMPLAREGRLANVEYLSLYHSAEHDSDLKDIPGAVEHFCQLMQAMPGLKVLLLGKLWGREAQAKQILQCLSSLPNLQELDVTSDIMFFSQRRYAKGVFGALRKTYGLFPRLRFLHLSDGFSQKDLDFLRRHALRQLSVVTDLDEVVLSGFQRSSCHPAHGMKAETILMLSAEYKAKDDEKQAKQNLPFQETMLVSASRAQWEADEQQKAQQKGCSVEGYDQMDLSVAMPMLAERVVDSLAQHCVKLSIKLRDKVWDTTVVELARDAIAWNMSVPFVARLYASADQNPGLPMAAFSRATGFARCQGHPCINLTHTAYGKKVLRLPLVRVLENPNSTGYLVGLVCHGTEQKVFTVSLLTKAVEDGSKDVVRSLMTCVRQKFKLDGSTGVHLPGSWVEPALRAITKRREDLLEIVLPVTGACHVLADGSAHGSTLLEMAVANACPACVAPLLSNGIDGTRLSFSWSSSPTHWRQGAVDVLAQLPLQRLSFAESTATGSWILLRLSEAISIGALKNLEYLNLHDIVVDAEAFGESNVFGENNTFVKSLCSVLKAMPHLKVLFLGKSIGPFPQAAKILVCLVDLPGLQETDMDPIIFKTENGEEEEQEVSVSSVAGLYGQLGKLRHLHLYEDQDGLKMSERMEEMKRHLPSVSIDVDLTPAEGGKFQRQNCTDQRLKKQAARKLRRMNAGRVE